MSADAPLDVEVWSDVICPWCRIGRAHLDLALAEFEHADRVRVTYRSFELEPTAPAEQEESVIDHLAAKFRASGGSFKSLIREMVLSRTYQLAAEAKSPRTIADPENRLFGRRSYRRLTAEEIRDSLLFLTGELKLEQAAATALTYGEDLDKPMKFDIELRRSIYLPVARNNLAPELEIFDVATPEMVSGDRPLTTVPTQALYLLNSTFLQKQGATLAQQAYVQADPVTWLHQAILGRAPSATAASSAATARRWSGRPAASTHRASCAAWSSSATPN